MGEETGEERNRVEVSKELMNSKHHVIVAIRLSMMHWMLIVQRMGRRRTAPSPSPVSNPIIMQVLRDFLAFHASSSLHKSE